MRILQVITTTDVGGAEYHLLGLCSGLVARGHRVEVAYLKGAGTLDPDFRRLGIEPRPLGLERAVAAPLALARLVRRCRRLRPDVVHTHLLKANVLGAVAARLAGCRAIVASKHNDEPQLRQPSIAAVHRRLSRLDRHTIHASRHIRHYMETAGGVDPERGSTIHYGLDLAAFDGTPRFDLRAALGLGPERLVVGCVARLIHRKGHRHLLAALRRALDHGAHGEDRLALVIIGGGPEEAELRRLTAELGLEDHVRFTGERTDVPALLPSLDVFALASDAEGLGLVLIEAMAASLPVVITRVGGMPELVEVGVTGSVVPAADVEALATALVELAADDDRRHRLGAAGRRRVERDFTLAGMVDRIEAVYRDVTAAE